MKDEVEIIQIFFGEKAVAFFIFLGLDTIKFLLPKAYQGSINIETCRDFSNGIKELFGFFVVFQCHVAKIEKANPLSGIIHN